MYNSNYQSYLNHYFNYNDLLWQEYEKDVKDNNVIQFSSASGSLVAVVEIQEWDSLILGIRTGKIKDIFWPEREIPYEEIKIFARSLDKYFQDLHLSFINFRLSLSETELWQAFIEVGWKPVDIMTIYCCDKLTEYKITRKEQAFSWEEAKELFDRCPDLFRHARMFRDHRIPQQKAALFYKELLHWQVNNPKAIRACLRDQGHFYGLAIGTPDEWLLHAADLHLAYLWLIGLDPLYQGRKLSRALLEEFLAQAAKVVDMVEIGTQVDNIPANRLYISVGAKPVATAITLHRWLS